MLQNDTNKIYEWSKTCVFVCVCVCVCMYLPSICYTRVVLSLYLYLSIFFLLLHILCLYHLLLQCIPSIYTYLENLLCFVYQTDFFLCVSSKLFINLYIAINTSLSLFSFSVVSCISFNLSLYVRSSKSDTILLAILCILFNFNTWYILLGGPYYFCIFQFWFNHCSYIFLIISLHPECVTK